MGCPARAGMDPRGEKRWRADCRLPRASGDGPWSTIRANAPDRAAPRERGWTLRVERVRGAPGGCPARAGMDPRQPVPSDADDRLPRASGDGPFASLLADDSALAAPRERGWTRSGSARHVRRLGCPARAGMDPCLRSAHGPHAGLPRASGDGPNGGDMVEAVIRAAPRERGWTLWFAPPPHK